MYQFLHIESYSLECPKKGKAGGHSVSSIVNEARRAAGSVPHIKYPLLPLQVYGCPLTELEDKCREWADSFARCTGRKTRKDALCLLSGVISAPKEIEGQAWAGFQKDALSWLKEKYGDCLKAVVEHVDEASPHLHFYVIPASGDRFESVHDGRRAAAEMKSSTKGAQNRAYIQAMRNLQYNFNVSVASHYGMLRRGPRGRRLSRAAWVAEKEQAKNIRDVYSNIRRLKSELHLDRQKAIQKGMDEGVSKFLERTLLGKIIGIVVRAPRRNKVLSEEIGEMMSVADNWRNIAMRYKLSSRKYFADLKKSDIAKNEYKKEVLNVKALKSELEVLRSELAESMREARVLRIKASNAAELLRAYKEKEEELKLPLSAKDFLQRSMSTDVGFEC